MNNTIFWLIVEKATLHMQHVQKDDTLGSEDNPVQFGNVEYFKDKDGNWCYSIPVHQWNQAKIVNDLSYFF